MKIVVAQRVPPGDDAILGEIRYRDWPGRVPSGT